MISVIIPTLNEETSLPLPLETLSAAPGSFEVLVVDGQSTDSTREIARRYGRVLTCPPGRARQMNRGAQQARGDVLLFLHADTLLPIGAIRSIENALTNPRILGGNFDIVYEGRLLASRIFTVINRWRRRCGIFYGDSGIFVRREVFRALGGFRPLPLMEDYDFARRLEKAGQTICLKDSLQVSARRWEEHGLLRTMAAWFVIHLFYYGGIPHRFWACLYPPIRRSYSPGNGTFEPASVKQD
ncbi:MAG: TIGR04283 family arsenosugar biosynthesis glycosyltransferase [Acidobacteria bacterium]|nr:TIGR04283 family arsenosugar biosynthesis glycosyltransferase [Acidobacteriota bacterium]